MLGEQKSNFYTVKDIAPADFINAFAQYLKKNNLIERPKWADLVKTSTGMYHII
jgi:small subunit ribosomal protein S19e